MQILNDNEIIAYVSSYTMVSRDRLWNVLTCIDYIVQNNIPGDFIEIGVWKGGVIMAMAMKCKQLGIDRTIHAYDTFEGMTTPGMYDSDRYGNKAEDNLESVMCVSSYEDTLTNIALVNYPNIVIHKGDIRRTDMSIIPKVISLLRLDTDWYDLTKFELEYFEPNVSGHGCVLIDDYGYWQGCKRAVDEFLEKKKNIVPVAVDDTGIFWIKP